MQPAGEVAALPAAAIAMRRDTLVRRIREHFDLADADRRVGELLEA